MHRSAHQATRTVTVSFLFDQHNFRALQKRFADNRASPFNELAMDTEASYRYEQLADLIVSTVDNGTLGPGMRLPSVRAVSQQHGISISTVLQAYRLLEDRGVLVARP